MNSRWNNDSQTINGLPSQFSANCHYIGQVVSHGHPAAISDCRKLMGVIVTDQHFLMLQTLPERIHHEQVRKFWGKVYAQFLQEEKHVIYKRESGLLNPLEHLTSNIHGDSIHVEVPQVNENQTDEFCDVEASKITTAFSLGIFANILLALLLKVTLI